MEGIPQWLGAPVLAATIAALGYVLKLLIDELNKWRARRYEQQSRLVALQSMLLASRRVYETQNAHLRSFICELKAAGFDVSGSFDEVLAAAYPKMDERQRLRHGLLRSYTTNAMRPLNLAMIDWLAVDNHFKGKAGTGAADDLASNLQTLEAHLLLWRAKYDFWIPDRPERAIVYMADERQHEMGFPVGIEDLIAKRTGGLAETPVSGSG